MHDQDEATWHIRPGMLQRGEKKRECQDAWQWQHWTDAREIRVTGSLFAVHVVSIIIAGRLPVATNRKELLILAGVASGTFFTSTLLSISAPPS